METRNLNPVGTCFSLVWQVLVMTCCLFNLLNTTANTVVQASVVSGQNLAYTSPSVHSCSLLSFLRTAVLVIF